MANIEQWIWVDSNVYPRHQTTRKWKDHPFNEDGQYAVTEFIRSYKFDCAVKELRLRFSGDTEFDLTLNGKVLGTGPIMVGGDFLQYYMIRPSHYASELTVYPDSDTLDFFARVKLNPVDCYEYTQGHGGFMLFGEVLLADGRIKYIKTDEKWLSRVNKAYTEPFKYDATAEEDEFIPSVRVQNIWKTKTSPIPMRYEGRITPVGDNIVIAKAHETVDKKIYEFDMIHGGFIELKVKCEGLIKVRVVSFETYDHKEDGTRVLDSAKEENYVFTKDTYYRGLQLRSIGAYEVTVENLSDKDCQIELAAIATHYPVYTDAKIKTDNEDINLVLDVCRHTLKYCRQMIHLDSLHHLEPLACTGDYYIQTLMTAMSFGDMSLARMDTVRTAELLRYNDGRMFHTTYSLIWVRMLWDVYMYTADKKLLEECEDALTLLLDRFETYMGETGLLETPPDYMFVDWIYIDGISMHHPPKALGQTCLNAFYYQGLEYAAKIYGVLNRDADRDECLRRSEELKANINEKLFDKEKGIYFEGLNTPTPEDLLESHMPQNVEKRYYLPHSNILCACFGVCDKERGRSVLKKVMDKEFPTDCQPYFKHYLFEAIYRNGLREEYTMRLSEDWIKPVKDCPKGLAEGFIPPEPTYRFDHSHAWGGTPLYSIPQALTGIEILEAGYKKISISPSALGLEKADVEIPTPFGMISFNITKDGYSYSVPDGITVEEK